jgi:hypothetical protein
MQVEKFSFYIKENLLLILGFLVFCCLTFIIVGKHELWRDETHTLIVVKECKSIFDIYYKTRYDGHPLLWYYIVYALDQLNFSDYQMQLFHWSIGCSVVFLFLFYAKVEKFWKLLIIFGYFFTYEYTILFRNYSLGILFLFLSLIFLEKKKFVFFVLALIIAMQANFFSMLIACFLWMFAFKEHVVEHKKLFIGSSFFIVFGIYLYYLSALTFAKDYDFQNGVIIDITSIGNFFYAFGNSILNIPLWNKNFWNSNIFNPEIKLVISITLYFLTLKMSINEKKIFYFFFITSFFTQIFFGVKYFGSIRHHGHIYLILIISLWLHGIFYKYQPIFTGFKKYFFTTIFLTQIYATLNAYFHEFNYSFSDAKKAADLINKNYINYNLLAYPDYTGAIVSYYTNKSIFFLDEGKLGTFMKFCKSRNKNYSDMDFFNYVRSNNVDLENTLIIKNEKMNIDIQRKAQLKLVAFFNTSIVSEEIFYLYVKNR